MKRIFIAAGLTCVLAAAPAANTQGTAGSPAPKPPAGGSAHQGAHSAASALAAPDRTFVMEAARGGMAEVELGRLAVEKASNADVKQFGQRMVDDHGKANDELKAFASQKNVTLPTEPGAKHKAEHARMSKLSGAQFDRAYMAAMVADHDKDVAAFQRASKTARDADLKAWAGKTLPTLQEHQKMAKDINAKVRGAATPPATKTPADKK